MASTLGCTGAERSLGVAPRACTGCPLCLEHPSPLTFQDVSSSFGSRPQDHSEGPTPADPCSDPSPLYLSQSLAQNRCSAITVGLFPGLDGPKWSGFCPGPKNVTIIRGVSFPFLQVGSLSTKPDSSSSHALPSPHPGLLVSALMSLVAAASPTLFWHYFFLLCALGKL